jgi:hypothetical protein
MNDKPRPSGLAGYENIGNGENPCLFMKLPRCMRQDTSKRLDFDICQACIAGRMEGHLFAIKQKLVGPDQNRGNN